MENTEPGPSQCLRTGESLAKADAPASAAAEPGPIRRLTLADLPAALRLSVSASWNQNDSDWRTMLQLGQGWGIDAVDTDGHTQLAASLIVLPYGEHFAWTSMVLVLPAFQRRGYAQQLLRFVLPLLTAEGRMAVLDATPAGHAVYVQQGFQDTWGFARYRREADVLLPGQHDGPPTRALKDSDWPAIEAMDAPAFGASRLPLLRALAQRLPQAARVAERGSGLCGYVLGRDGREACQIGPLLAADDATARSLLHDALQTLDAAVYVDLLDSQRQLLPWLERRGFAIQRTFTRMVHGAPRAPGNPSTIVLAAGPELG